MSTIAPASVKSLHMTMCPRSAAMCKGALSCTTRQTFPRLDFNHSIFLERSSCISPPQTRKGRTYQRLQQVNVKVRNHLSPTFTKAGRHHLAGKMFFHCFMTSQHGTILKGTQDDSSPDNMYMVIMMDTPKSKPFSYKRVTIGNNSIKTKHCNQLTPSREW